MAATYELLAKLKADSSDFVSGMRSAESASDGFSSKVGGAMKGVAGFVGGAMAAAGAAAVGFGAVAFNAASDLGESISKVNVVFGQNAEEVKKWASTSATAMGMTQQQALEAAGTFGNFMQAMGLSQKEAQSMSTSMVGLASDLASFNNANPEDVLLALRSGLAGETEPLRKFGVNLSAARIEAEAMAAGINKNYNELTGAEKSMLAYNVIMKDTTLAQGDFARTADGAANQMRIMKAQVTDMAATVGQALLPVGTQLIGALSGALTQIGPVLGEIAQTIANSILPLIDQLGPLISGALSALSPVFQSLLPPLLNAITLLVEGLGPVLIDLINPVMSVLTAITPLLAPLAEVLVIVGQVLGTVIAAGFQLFADLLGTAAQALMPFVSQLADNLQPVFETLGTVIEDLPLDALFDAFQSIFTAIGPILPLLGQLISDIVSALAPALPPIIEAVSEVAAALSGALGSALSAILPPVMKVAQILAGALGDAVTMLAPIIAKLATAIGTVLGRVFERLGPILDKVADLVGVLAESLISALAPILPPLADLLLQLIDAFLPLLDPLLSMIETLLPPFVTLLELLLPPVAQLAGLLAGALAVALGTVVGWVVKIVDKLTNLQEVAKTVWNAVWGAIKGAWDLISPVFDAIVNFVKSYLIAEFNVLKFIVMTVWDAISGAIAVAWGRISGIFDALRNGIGGVASFIRDRIDDVVGFFLGIADRVAGVGRSIADAIIEGFKSAWNTVSSTINSIIPDEIGFGIGPSIDLPDNPLPRFHKGGMVPGAPGSEVPALLQAGEMVLSRAQVAALDVAKAPPPPAVSGSVTYVTYEVQIDVPVSADRATVGQQFVESIVAYERRNGSEWRS